MNREIKFRGQNRLGRFVYGIPLLFDTNKNREEVTLVSRYIAEDGAEHQELWIVQKGTIGQYTGLKDHHGKEIYEGDIVRATSLSISTLGAFRDAIVKYDSDAGAYILVCGNRSSYLYVMAKCVLEIIGNIHETPAM